MIHITDLTKCCGCAACAKVCPAQCITMKPDKTGTLYPSVRTKACIGCGQCEAHCPMIAAPPLADETIRKTFAAYHKQLETRLRSSSGGAFSALASTVIRTGGVVFGAAFDEQMHLRHTAAQTEAELEPLMGSKYVQSALSVCFSELETALREDKTVLFCGTPCQCAAVKKLFTHEKLITVSVVCHGVPAPSLWDEYLKRCAAAAGSRVTGCNMRDKRGGWVNYQVSTTYENGTTRSKWNREDAYLAAYLSDRLMRPSCTDCLYKGDYHVADILLGDLWSAEKVCGAFANHTGMNVIIVQTKKGETLLEQAAPLLALEEVSFDAVADENPMLDQSPARKSAPPVTAQTLLDEYATPKITLLQRAVKQKHDLLFKRDLKRNVP